MAKPQIASEAKKLERGPRGPDSGAKYEFIPIYLLGCKNVT